MTIFLLIAVAGCLLFWPFAKKSAVLSPALPVPSADPTPVEKIPTFIQATENLSVVRKRLLKTDLLDDEQREAIDVLQLALTAGSDQ